MRQASTTKGAKLDWIEAGRGLAAMAVVCSHMLPFAHLEIAKQLGLGAMGVEFFFLLSGFIIFYVHRLEFGAPSNLTRYAWRRAGRIFATYWFVLALVFLLTVTLVRPDTRPPVTFSFLLQNILLLPGHHPLVTPSWTLRHELLFYALFSTFIINRAMGLIVFFAWFFAILFGFYLIGPSNVPTQTSAEIFFHHYNLDFFIGIAAAIFANKRKEMNVIAFAVPITIILLVIWAIQGFPADSFARVFASKAGFLALLGISIALSRSTIRAPGALLLLGSASYSIYLANRNVGLLFGRALGRLGGDALVDSWWSFLLSVALAAALGIAIFLLYEQRVLRWVNSRPWALRREVAHGASREEAENGTGK